MSEESPMPVEIPTVVQDYRKNLKYSENVRNAPKIKYLDEESQLVSPIDKIIPS